MCVCVVVRGAGGLATRAFAHAHCRLRAATVARRGGTRATILARRGRRAGACARAARVTAGACEGTDQIVLRRHISSLPCHSCMHAGEGRGDGHVVGMWHTCSWHSLQRSASKRRGARRRRQRSKGQGQTGQHACGAHHTCAQAGFLPVALLMRRIACSYCTLPGQGQLLDGIWESSFSR